LRNAPTSMMKNLGYGKAYAYYFDDPEGSFAQRYFPETMKEKQYYQAGSEGWEGKVRSRLEELKQAREKARKEQKRGRGEEEKRE
jgi:putative ATPase